jgi:hypothetical protein
MANVLPEFFPLTSEEKGKKMMKIFALFLTFLKQPIMKPFENFNWLVF